MPNQNYIMQHYDVNGNVLLLNKGKPRVKAMANPGPYMRTWLQRSVPSIFFKGARENAMKQGHCSFHSRRSVEL